MPARSPPVVKAVIARLGAIGRQVREQRKALGVSSTAAAEAAGMSRVTLYRIEHGEPSVAAGAYLNAILALGLELEIFDPRRRMKQAKEARRKLPAAIRLADFPELQRIAWQLKGVEKITAKEAFDLYERNWRHVDPASMLPQERTLARLLVDAFGGGRLLV